jgi:hypothetical protein
VDDPPGLSRGDIGETASGPFSDDVSVSFLVEVAAAESPSDHLLHRARARLVRIMRQCGLGDDEKTGLETAFHQFITSAESRVGVRVGFDQPRYLRPSTQTEPRE